VEDNDAAESALRRHGIPIALKSEIYR
jgi:hypothetical protein